MPEPQHKRTSRFDFTLEEIRTWGGDRQFVEALEQYANKGDVLNPRFENGIGEADIQHAGHVLHTRFRTLPGKRHMVENLCPCASSQRDGRICEQNAANRSGKDSSHGSHPPHATRSCSCSL